MRSGAVDTDIGRVAWVGLGLLVTVAPFEAFTPLIAVPGQSISTSEAVLLAVFGLCAGGVVLSRRRLRWRTSLTLPWIALLLVSLVAALAATANRTNALHMVGRLTLGLGAFVVAVNGSATRCWRRRILLAGVACGGVVSVIIILEYLRVGVVLDALRVFRPAVFMVGTQARAAGPFAYPTIASMYLEIVFAFGLGLLIDVTNAGRLGVAVALVATLALISEAVTLTFTRAGLLTVGASLIIVGVRHYRLAGRGRGTAVIALLAVIVAVQVVASRSAEAILLRMTSEGQDEWFRVTIDPPSDLSLRTGETAIVPIRVTNAGRTAWDPRAEHPVRFSYHWLRSNDERVVVWEGLRTLLAAPVAAGETVTLQAQVQAPGEPGVFRLLWDIEQQDRLWFSMEPQAPRVTTRAAVSGPLVSTAPAQGPREMPRSVVRPGRAVLWRAAFKMFMAHPLTGVGPDNFRLMYGEYAGIADADVRVHSNNMYLEILAGTGLAGGVASLWFFWCAARQFAAAARNTEPEISSGILAAGVAIALHGVFDSFLGFTPTYVLFAVVAGLAVTAADRRSFHAHRL